MNKILSHLDDKGKARMVDISGKEATMRQAKAFCKVKMKKETLDLIISGRMPKGDVFTTAKIAGIMAAKKTAELIPMCHPLDIASADISFERLNDTEIEINAQVKLKGLTGVEMEALTACAVAALTVYDMVKSQEKGIVISELKLLEKEGGKSGKWQADTNHQPRIVSLNISAKKGRKKKPVDSIALVKDKGVETDAHFDSKRQVSLLPAESIQRMKDEGLNVKAGSFAENITISGINLADLRIGTKLKLGPTLVEITEIGKECHAPCAIYKKAGYCVMPEDGVFVRVLTGGKLQVGDKIQVVA